MSTTLVPASAAWWWAGPIWEARVGTYSPPVFFRCIYLTVQNLLPLLWHARSQLWSVASSSLTKDRSQGPYFGSTESWPVAHQGSPPSSSFRRPGEVETPCVPPGLLASGLAAGITRVPALLRGLTVWRFSQLFLPPLSHSEVFGEEESRG